MGLIIIRGAQLVGNSHFFIELRGYQIFSTAQVIECL